MKKIFYASDLHLEMGASNIVIPKGDIAILAGDIFIAHKKYHKKYIDNFFDELTNSFTYVLYVFGNHEYYFNDYNFVRDDIEDYFYKNKFNNIIILENDDIFIDDIAFFGSVFWTDLKNNDPLVTMQVHSYINDFKTIKIENEPLKPYHTIEWNRIARKSLNNFLKKYKDFDKKIVITHHAPFSLSCDEKFLFDDVSYGYYNTQLENTDILDEKLIWIHGHMHDPVQYEIGNIKVISNPRGYENFDFSLKDKFVFKQVQFGENHE